MPRGVTPPKGAASTAPATPPPFRGSSSTEPRTAEAARRREAWTTAAAESRTGAQDYAEKQASRLSDVDRVLKINLDHGQGASFPRKAFEVLGVAANSTMDALSKAKRDWLKRFHPNANNNSLAAESADVQGKFQSAYQTVQEAFSQVTQYREKEAEQDQERAEAERQKRERAAAAAERERQRQEELNRLKEEDRQRRLAEIRRMSAKAKANLQQRMSGHPLMINTEALKRAIKEAEFWLHDVNIFEQAHSALIRAEQQQQQVSCEMAGRADLKSGVVCGIASEVGDSSDEFFAVGVFPCRAERF